MNNISNRKGNTDMNMNAENQDMNRETMGNRNSMSMSGNMRNGMRNMNYDTEEKHKRAEDIYSRLSEHMCKGLAFHEQLADYFCFLGLQGFKRMADYQYMCECAEKRKVHKHYIDAHHRIIPVKQTEVPEFIPRDWVRYTTRDIDDNVVPRFVRMGLTAWEEWEEETKALCEELANMAMSYNMVTDYEYLKSMAVDVEKELKKVERIMESMNGTGYDVNAIHSMQDKLHEKYKTKYNERFKKNKENRTEKMEKGRK